MVKSAYANPEILAKPERRRFNAEYKHRILAEADACQHGELGALLRREGLYYGQIIQWRKEREQGRLVNKPRGAKANPHQADMKRLRAENERLQRKLARAELIIEAQKKLSRLLDSLKDESL